MQTKLLSFSRELIANVCRDNDSLRMLAQSIQLVLLHYVYDVGKGRGGGGSSARYD